MYLCGEAVLGGAATRLTGHVTPEDGVHGVEEAGLPGPDLAYQHDFALTYLQLF
jgi:hypothetical protein